ncbi:unnamed protein product [Boreogadus saida]
MGAWPAHDQSHDRSTSAHDPTLTHRGCQDTATNKGQFGPPPFISSLKTDSPPPGHPWCASREPWWGPVPGVAVSTLVTSSVPPGSYSGSAFVTGAFDTTTPRGDKWHCPQRATASSSGAVRRRPWTPPSTTAAATLSVPFLPTNQSEVCAAAGGADATLANTLFGVFYVLVFFLALNGNALALWIFSHQRAGAASPANVFMQHLAVADLCLVFVLPLRAAYHLTGGHWPFGEAACRAAGFLFYVNMYASLYFLACVAGDRYLAVVHAVRSLKARRARSAHVASLLLWAMVAVSMAPLLLSRQTADVRGVTVCRQLYREKASRRALVSLGVAFTPPFLFTLACYLLIVRSLRRGGSRLDPALKAKALRTIGLVMLIYVLCFLPYHVSRATFILGYARPDVGCGARRALSLANRLTSALTCLNAALDPLVYLFGAEKFRGTVRRMFCRRRREEAAGISAATSGELKGTHESSLSAKSEF